MDAYYGLKVPPANLAVFSGLKQRNKPPRGAKSFAILKRLINRRVLNERFPSDNRAPSPENSYAVVFIHGGPDHERSHRHSPPDRNKLAYWNLTVGPHTPA